MTIKGTRQTCAFFLFRINSKGMWSLFFLNLIFIATSFSSTVISSQAGRLQDKMLTTRQVLLSAVIERAVSTANDSSVSIKDLNLNRPYSRGFVKQATAALIEWAVFFEAQSFGAAEVTDKEVRQAQTALQKKVKSDLEIKSVWSQLQPTEDEVKKAIERKLRSKKFIRFKIESSTLPITDKEAHEYFESHRLQFEDQPFEKFKPKIKELLSRQQVDRRIKDWFDLLHAKYKIKNELSVDKTL